METRIKGRWLTGPVLALFALAVTPGVAASAQEDAAADSAAGEGAEVAQYQFNLAPAKTAPAAVGEVLLTARPEGGYEAELAAMSLPEPSALKPDATTYVVWLYDPAAKKKERVAALTPDQGGGVTTFDVTWPSFALVVTAEPSPTPQEWSGIAVLTGQPVLPENPGTGAGGGGGAGGPSASAPPAGADSAAEAAGATGVTPGAPGGVADPAVTSPSSTPEAAAPADEPAGAVASAEGAAAEAPPADQPAPGDPAAQPPAGPAVAAEPPAGAEVGADASAGVGVAVESDPAEAGEAGEAAVSAESPAPCVAAAEPEEDTSKKKKKRFSNPALDALAAAQRKEEQPCPPTDAGGNE